MKVSINVNDTVYVKLTELGKKELQRQHDDLHDQFPMLTKRDFMHRKEDDEGWSEWQLWDLMGSLGHKCIHGCSVPFETTIEFRGR